MRRNSTEWAYLTDESGREWLSLSKGGDHSISLLRDGNVPARAIYAVPTFCLVTVPKWVNSKESNIISEVIAIDSEQLGVRSEDGPGKLVEWRPIDQNGTRTLIKSIAIPWSLPETDSGQTDWVEFIPQFELYQPPLDSIVIWKEESRWTCGYVRDERWVYAHNLGEVDAFSLAAKEIALTALELNSKGYIPEPKQIIVWSAPTQDIQTALEKEFDIPVHFQPKPQPSANNTKVWSLEPHNISTRKSEAKSRRRGSLLVALLTLGILLLAAGGVFHLKQLETGNTRLRAMIAKNQPEADKIERTIEKWNTLGPAIAPERSPVEIFHQLSMLVPQRGFRITSFEYLNNKTIVIRGEAETLPVAIQFKEKLTQCDQLKDYKWELPQPQPKGDIATFFAQGHYRFTLSSDPK